MWHHLSRPRAARDHITWMPHHPVRRAGCSKLAGNVFFSLPSLHSIQDNDVSNFSNFSSWLVPNAKRNSNLHSTRSNTLPHHHRHTFVEQVHSKLIVVTLGRNLIRVNKVGPNERKHLPSTLVEHLFVARIRQHSNRASNCFYLLPQSKCCL